MKITIFGLTLSSSWGNGHATPYRAILRALHRRGIEVTFYEKDVPYYSRHRDFGSWHYCRLVLYDDWNQVRGEALAEARASDVTMVGSYSPEGARIAEEVLGISQTLKVFYDLDTPITLRGVSDGTIDYLRREQMPLFDLYLSFTGGRVLERLRQEFGVSCPRPLYGCVDPEAYRRVDSREQFRCALSYMGTYAADRHDKLENLFLEPARRQPKSAFLLAGSLYPTGWAWPPNVRRYDHVAPQDHPALYSSSTATLNLTRQEMADSGYCPSGRFFEAAACGTPILTDVWDGLDSFFEIGSEVIPVRSPEDVISALHLPAEELQGIAENARRRTLAEHTGDRRADELLTYCEEAFNRNRYSMEVAS